MIVRSLIDIVRQIGKNPGTNNLIQPFSKTPTSPLLINEFRVKLGKIRELTVPFNIFPTLDITTTCLSMNFRRVTSEDISRIIKKYGHDFEICGYNDTLHELKRLAKIKR